MTGFRNFVYFDPDTGDIRSMVHSNVLVAMAGYSLALYDPGAGAVADTTHRVDLSSLTEDDAGNLVVGAFVAI